MGFQLSQKFIRQLNNTIETTNEMKFKIYLDDERIPNDKDWLIVKNYGQFIKKISDVGLENIDVISFDHDLGDTAVEEYFRNVIKKGILDYDNIEERTGYDAAKWLVGYYMDNYTNSTHFPQVYVHSANPVGAANIVNYINGFLKHMDKEQTAKLKVHPFTIQDKK
jgi:hypothetical protein